MKLSKPTIEMLRFASRLNNSLLFKPGKSIRTLTSNKTNFMEAVVEETFPVECAVLDVAALLKKLDSATEVDFSPKDHIALVNGRMTSRITKADPNLVLTPNTIKLPIFEEQMFLHFDDLQSLHLPKKHSISNSKPNTRPVPKPKIVFHAEKKGAPILIDIVEFDGTVQTTVEPRVLRKATQPFRLVMKKENVVLMPGSYEIEIAKPGFTRWTWLHGDLKMTIAGETASSSFGTKHSAQQKEAA